MNESLSRDKRARNDRLDKTIDSQSITQLRGQILKLKAENSRLKEIRGSSKESTAVRPNTREVIVDQFRKISATQTDSLTWENLSNVLERTGMVDAEMSKQLVDLARHEVIEGATHGTVDADAFVDWLYDDM